jgi:hypothetical protein
MDGGSDLDLLKTVVGILSDGLKYGNWPWSPRTVSEILKEDEESDSFDNLPDLVVGRKYRIRYKSDTRVVSRWAVMKYLGRKESTREGKWTLIWDLRPVAGTQEMPEHWVISTEEVDMDTSVCIDKRWTEESN